VQHAGDERGLLGRRHRRLDRDHLAQPAHQLVDDVAGGIDITGLAGYARPVRILAGIGLGALVGLLVASLYNSNCDSLIEIANGCSRVKVSFAVGAGAFVGLIVGAVVSGPRAKRD
jgi:hypothetical protein